MLTLDLLQTVAFAGLILFAGYGIKRVVPLLARLNIPAPVAGGLPVAALLALLRGWQPLAFDTTLQVYTGNSLGALTSIAFNDDAGGALALRSRVVFPVNAGTTYRIQVDGFNGANGLLNLHVQNGPCQRASGWARPSSARPATT